MVKNILQMLEETAGKFPEKTAFSDRAGGINYKEVVAYAKSIGTCISETGQKGKAVAVILDKSKESLVSYMGVVYSGNFYVPIDTKMPDDRIKKILDTVEPCAILADEKNHERSQTLGNKIKVIQYSDALKTNPDEETLLMIRRKSIDTDPIYALFTSGSTGIPKGVVCCHRSVIDYADWLIDTFGFDEKTIFGNQTQFYFSMSVLDIYATIRSGAELHIIPQNLFTFPIKLLEHMNEYRVNTVYWVPTALCTVANLRALDKVQMPYLKKILFAGEAMPVKQLNIWRKHLPEALYANLFGPTEITDIGVYYIVNRDFADDESLPIGTACDNVDILILDENDKEVSAGEKGELCIRGSFLALGYYNNPEKTSEVFIQNPFNRHYPELIYKTGDIVSVNAYGELMYHGRKDYQIKHRGNRIELGEIEAAAGRVEGIDICVCVYDDMRQRIVLLYKGKEIADELFIEALREKISEYMLPNVFIRLKEFPCNANGKIDRKQLKGAYIDGKLEEFGRV